MKDPSKLFRKVALERLSSPEQLDQLLTVTSPRGWLALTGLTALLTAAVLWGIFGSVPTKVRGECILMSEQGISVVRSPSSGTLASIYGLEEGDSVQAGQVIARVDQPALQQQIDNKRLELKGLQRRLEQKKQEITSAKVIEIQTVEKRRASLNEVVTAEGRRLDVLRDRVDQLEKLYKRGLISQSDLLQSREELIQADQTLKQAQISLDQIELEFLEHADQHQAELFVLQQQVLQTEDEIILFNTRLEAAARIEAPFTGTITEIAVRQGGVVEPGQELLAIELSSETENLDVIAYLMPGDGKQLEPGMRVQVSPATVKAEEYGYMVGAVDAVSEFPVSSEKILKQFGNPDLVRAFTASGDPIMMVARLQTAESTPSGYVWTSREGPPHGVFGGTVCSVLVTVREQPPITLVIPTLKKFFGLA